MIKVLVVRNSSNGMSIKMPTIEEAINKAIEDNNVDENSIINIEFIRSSEVNIIYKSNE